MKYKRQILILLIYCILFVLSCFWSANSRLGQAIRTPIAQIYYISSLVFRFFIYFSILSNLIDWYLKGFLKRLNKTYPQIDPAEFDVRKFENKPEKKELTLVQPFICVIICTPYLYYFFTNQYELKILFGILANLTIIFCFVPSFIETYINRFLFMRHLDQLLNNPK
jgi:hypothetical protein